MESEVLRRFYSDVQCAITDPIGVASLLHQKDVVGKVLLDEVSPSNKVPYPEKTASIMRHVEAAVRVDPKSFWVFLSVLNQFTPCYKVAMRMKQAVNLHALAAERKGSPSSSQNSKDEVTVSVVYKEDFDAIEKEFVSLHLRASHIILKSSVTLQELKELLSFYPQLAIPIQNAESVIKVMQVIQQHSSFINCSYLKHVAEYFNLPEVTKQINNYNKLVDDFCNNKIIQHSYMKPFTTNPPQYNMSSQTIKIKIVLQWNPATKTLSDIRSLLEKAFQSLSSLIHVDVIGEGSITVVCYAPHYIMGALLKMTRKNKNMLLENGVSYLSIGYTVVLDSISQKVSSLEGEIHDLKERNTSSLSSLQDVEPVTTAGDKLSSLQLTPADVIHAYDVSLRASKEKEQQLQSQLATVQQESQDKEQQLSKLEDENYDLHKEMISLKYENEQQQEELKRLQQKAGEDEVRVIASKEEQQRLLQVVEQWQRTGRARDVQISQLQNENELVQDKYDALKASYQHLEAASNEKQSVDTVDTGVQAASNEKQSVDTVDTCVQADVAPGETGPEDTELRFTALKFYKPIPGTLKVDFIFVVVCNHEVFLELIRKEYIGYTEDKPSLMLVFDEDVIVLDLPDSTPQVVNDWKLLPLTHPEIAKLDILKFKHGKNAPACSVELEWTGSGEPKPLSHQVKIVGAKKPAYFYMHYYPQAVATDISTSALVTSTMAGSSFSKIQRDATITLLKLKSMKGADGQPLKIIETVAAGDYMTFGMFLLQDENRDRVDLIKDDHIQDGAVGVTLAILKKWLTSGAPTRTYQHLIKCLEQSELGALAEKIADVISY